MASPSHFLWSIAACLAIAGFTAVASAAEKVDFQRQIRPLLADKCFACHGRDSEHREGGLRLDQREAAGKGGDSGEPAVVPGQPEKSELVRRIHSTDDAERMPPPDSKKTLTDVEKELLRRWVAEGAEYQAHWAFTAPARPPVPTVKNESWPKNEIDRFVLARLEQEGLQQSPAADPVTLLRRLTLDLTGLPPEPSEVEAFVSPSLRHSVWSAGRRDGETERRRDGIPGGYRASARFPPLRRAVGTHLARWSPLCGFRRL
jgi:hypothetical protein